MYYSCISGTTLRQLTLEWIFWRFCRQKLEDGGTGLPAFGRIPVRMIDSTPRSTRALARCQRAGVDMATDAYHRPATRGVLAG